MRRLQQLPVWMIYKMKNLLLKKYLYALIYLAPFLLIVAAGCERSVDSGFYDDGIPPAVPVGISLYSATDGEVIITWRPNVERDFDRYNVYRAEEEDSLNFKLIDFTRRTYYIDDSLEYDKKYFYRLTASDIFNLESNPTGIISAVPLNVHPPSKPRELIVLGRNWEGEREVYLTWRRNPESDVAGYKIFRSEDENILFDSASLKGFTSSLEFSDTTAGGFYKNYFYAITAVDRGELESEPSNISSDMILEAPELIFPENNSTVDYFTNFKIKTVSVPAGYKIFVQTNQFFGEIWSSEFFNAGVSDTIEVRFNPLFLYRNQNYFWRAAAYTKQNEPNSISPQFRFILK
jgi:hypothetical protein